jgi:hypothetical protein
MRPPTSNHTETSDQILCKRTTYVSAHLEYFDYLHLLLDRAALPHCNVQLPNLTTMAAMVVELQGLYPTTPWLNGVVLGRLLHRVLPGMLTWHGGRDEAWHLACKLKITQETTVYRFPTVQRGRSAVADFVVAKPAWTNDHDQWQGPARDEEW